MFITMFLGSAVSVFEQVGIRSVFIDMLLGSTVSMYERGLSRH